VAVVSHVLVSLTLEDGTTRTGKRTPLPDTSEVETKLAAGEKFEDLAKQYSGDPSSGLICEAQMLIPGYRSLNKPLLISPLAK